MANFVLTTDVVAWTEENRFQSEHQLAQEASLSVLKNVNPLEGVQMNVDCNLGLQSVGQAGDRAVLVARLLRYPKVIEPERGFDLEVESFISLSGWLPPSDRAPPKAGGAERMTYQRITLFCSSSETLRIRMNVLTASNLAARIGFGLGWLEWCAVELSQRLPAKQARS